MAENFKGSTKATKRKGGKQPPVKTYGKNETLLRQKFLDEQRQELIDEGYPEEDEKAAKSRKKREKKHKPRKSYRTPGILGIPIEELDPLLNEKTFCVLTRKFDQHYVCRFSATPSLYLYTPTHPFRQLCIKAYTHQLFDLIVMFIIVLNCIALAFDNNQLEQISDPKLGVYWDLKDENMPDWVDRLEWPFLIMFSVEALIKIVAKGFCFNRHSYLSNHWNKLDFIIVIAGYMTTVISRIADKTHPGDENGVDLDVFKAIRVFRAVKIISIFPGLRIMLNSITNSIVQLIEVMILTLFFLCIFSLFALNLFKGKLHQVCLVNNDTCFHPAETEECARWLTDPVNWVHRTFPKKEPMPCAGNFNDSSTTVKLCPEGYSCKPRIYSNPDRGWTSFDNFFQAMLSTFQLITLDYWERLYEIVMATAGAWSIPFFVMVIFLGSFYLMNLMLAVVAISYEAELGAGNEEPLSPYAKLLLNRSSSTFSLDEPLREFDIKHFTKYRKSTKKQRERVIKILTGHEEYPLEGHSPKTQGVPLNEAMDHVFAERFRDPILDEHTFNREKFAEVLEMEERVAYQQEVIKASRRAEDGEIMGAEVQVEGSQFEVYHGDQEGPPIVDFYISEEFDDSEFRDIPESFYIDEDKGEAIMNDGGRPYILAKYKTRAPGQVLSIYQKIRRLAEGLTNHWTFGLIITLCIIMNTLLLAAEHHNPDKWFEDLAHYGSLTFTGVFTVECLIKIFALHKRYFYIRWNLLDLLIVLTSVSELIATYLVRTTTDDKTANLYERFPVLNVIRVLRLLRIFKLAQSFITMKVLLNIIFSTFGSLANLTIVLFIMIFIFAVIGMQVVGKRYIPAHFGEINQDINDDTFPRWHFGDVFHSFMMIFRVLCGEWIEPLWDCLQAHEDKEIPRELSNAEWKCFTIFLPSLVIGNFVVMNLFLALLLNSFSSEEISAQREKVEETAGKLYDLKKVAEVMLSQKVVRQVATVGTDVLSLVAAALKAKREANIFTITVDEERETKARVMFKRAVQKLIMKQRVENAEEAIADMEEHEEQLQNDILTNIAVDMKEEVMRFPKNQLINAYARKRNKSDGCGYELHETGSNTSHISVTEDWEVKEEELEEEKPAGPPNCLPELFMSQRVKCCEFWNRSRKRCLKLVSSSVFEWVIIGFILASSITLCFEDIYLQKGSLLQESLKYLNYMFTFIFVVEMFLKWMALGFNEYFTSFWTLLDFLIVIISLVTLAFDIEEEMMDDNSTVKIGGRPGYRGNLAALKALRTLRALRPLRAISKWEGMKVIVNALLMSMPSIFNVLMVCLLFWLVFAITGVTFFKGKFFRCVYKANDEMVPISAFLSLNDTNKAECCRNSTSKNATKWVNIAPNFDNVMMAYLSLFQIATFEGWIEIMNAASDVTQVDQQPFREASYEYYAFFVVFIIFGSFFTLNLFIGVIIDNFNTLKKKFQGNFNDALLTESQRRYYAAMRKLGKSKPRAIGKRPKSCLLAIFYDLVTASNFEIIVILMILLNTISMAFDHYNQGPMQTCILQGIHGFFTALFLMEAFVKLMAFGRNYFKEPWNVFDFFLVSVSLFDLLESANLPFPPSLFRIIRVFRVGRLIRLVKAAKGIRKLLFTLMLSLPALFNIGALLALITFIYSIIGMALFKDVPYFPYEERKLGKDEEGFVMSKVDGPIDGFFSFETFTKSSLMLFRLFTAAGWNEVLEPLMPLQVSQCEGAGETDKFMCPSPTVRGRSKECVNTIGGILAVAFMVSYLVITYIIIINMYIAVILENFVEANHDEGNGIFEDDIEGFYNAWTRFDPLATQFIGFEDLSNFLASLEPPFEIPKPNLQVIVSLNFPIARGSKIHCLDVLHVLVKKVLGNVEGGDEFRKVQHIVDQMFKDEFPTRKVVDIVSSTKIWRLQEHAATVIQEAWKTYKRRKLMKTMAFNVMDLVKKRSLKTLNIK